jgi:hypothetical protein
MNTPTAALTAIVELPAGLLPALNTLLMSFLESGRSTLESIPMSLEPAGDIRRLFDPTQTTLPF